jgi:transcription elongation factor Elf1
MSIFIDRTFLLRVSPKLPKFAQKKEDLYNFRCPLCGDSEKHKNKARGYIYKKSNNYFYRCHNCGASTSFYNFLEQVDPSLLKEYALERYKNGENGNSNYKKPEFEEYKSKPTFTKKKTQTAIPLDSIDSLSESHFAKTYVMSRKIPEKFHKELYFAPDFKRFVEQLGIEKQGLIEKDSRLVIPFFDEDKNLIAFQGRSLGESKMRYITVKMNEDNNKFFGVDRIEPERMIYVVEGPIDSLFLDNAVATADANLQAVTKLYDKSNITLVFDNEPRNKDICRQMEKAIEDHFNVVIWPEMIESKDINDMILEGFAPDEIQDIISKNSFVNLRAKMEFVNWKKTDNLMEKKKWT